MVAAANSRFGPRVQYLCLEAGRTGKQGARCRRRPIAVIMRQTTAQKLVSQTLQFQVLTVLHNSYYESSFQRFFQYVSLHMLL